MDRTIFRSLATQTSHRTMSTSTSYVSPFAPKPSEDLTMSSSVPLPNGLTMPRFGIGTWEMFGSGTFTALQNAVEKEGYLHIDTAQYYSNEDQVGKFVRSSSIPRDQLFVTTKTFAKGVSARTSIEHSLLQAGLKYWDLVLIHAPDGGKEARLSAWKELSQLVKQGKVKSLGVSNYGEKHIQELLDSKPDVVPVTNQIECHPFFPQVSLRKFCEAKSIPVQSYCPLARKKHFGNSTLKHIASAHDKTPAQVMLRWAVQSGLVPLPKSSNPARQKENADAITGGWALSDEEMRQLDEVAPGGGRAVEIQTMSQDAR